MKRLVSAAALLVAVVSIASPAAVLAQTPRPMPSAIKALPSQPAGKAVNPKSLQPVAPADTHGANAHGSDPGKGDHGEHGAEHAHGTDQPINWIYGFIGEKDDITEETLVWRKKGRPVPLMASIINTAILFFGIYRYGKQPLAEMLQKRKEDLERGMTEAAKKKAEAEARLAEYEAKKASLEEEKVRIKKEYAEQAVREKERVLREAAEKRERMRRDAEFLLDQELKLARQALMTQTVDAAVTTAEKIIKQKLTNQDQERLADEFLKGLGAGLSSATGGVA